METEVLNIPQNEKENIKTLVSSLEQSAHSFNLHIHTQIVGGAVNKEWPRKDIDILCQITELKDNLKETQLEKAQKTINKLAMITDKAISNGNGFIIEEIEKPYMEHEFQNPNILTSNGKIRVKSPNGVPIEILPDINYTE